MIPRIAHFVFGLREQTEPLHFLHYLSMESCRRVLQPEVIYLHYLNLPYGPWWDRIAPHLTLNQVGLVPEVLAADYSIGRVPPGYLYAHHADFVRLDALVDHGGVYADIDSVFVAPFPSELFDAPFVIGTEGPVRDELTGQSAPSLCNALMMSEPGSVFARTWRQRMGQALNGTWSNHSGFLAQQISEEIPDAVRVEPEGTFFAFAASPEGLRRLLAERHPMPTGSVSVHLWAHLWWARQRLDFSPVHAGWCTPRALRGAASTLADLARPYTDDGPPDAVPWHYLSLDETSGYGVAAERCMDALEEAGTPLAWTPLVPGRRWGFGYAPPVPFDRFEGRPFRRDEVVVAQLVPEFFPEVRRRCGDAFLVGHTVWETDKVPDHWLDCVAPLDLLVVPSRFSAEAFQASGVAPPVEVVPHVAADPASMAPVTDRWEAMAGDRFVFYTIAEWNERKAVHLTIEAYLRAFRSTDPVHLIVKTSHRDHRLPAPAGRRVVEPGTTAWSLARLLARYPDAPPVSLVTTRLPEAEVVGLHVRGDAFVSLCRSEGWGLGAFDAATFANPVVTTGYGGHLDYLGSSPLLVDYHPVAVNDPAGWPSYAPDQVWAEPDIDHGAALLRVVHEQGRTVSTHSAELAGRIHQEFSPAAVAARMRRAVERHVSPRTP